MALDAQAGAQLTGIVNRINTGQIRIHQVVGIIDSGIELQDVIAIVSSRLVGRHEESKPGRSMPAGRFSFGLIVLIESQAVGSMVRRDKLSLARS